MHYLCTGAAGFVGTHLVQHLLARGDTATVLDITKPTVEIPGVEYITGSVTDQGLMQEEIRRHDAVFHLASVVGFVNVMRDPVSTITTSLYGGATVMHFASRAKKRVLFTSTSAVYGRSTDGGEVVRETDDCRLGPTTATSWSYAYAKAADECLAFAYYKQTGFPVIVARLFNTVGPGQSAAAGFVLPRFCRAALKGEPLLVHAPGTQTRTFAHVTDVTRGLAKLMETDGALGHIVNLGGTHTLSMWDLAILVRRLAESDSPIHLVPPPYGTGYDNVVDRKPCLDKARALIGYRPVIPLEKVIQDVLAEVRQEATT